MTKLSNQLLEAYRGVYDMLDEHEVLQRIFADSAKDRLAVYLQWNGIIGYTETIWMISQGGINQGGGNVNS